MTTTKKSLATVVAWCNLRNIRVEFSTIDDGVYYKEERLICINETEPLTDQLYTLLHECGHVLIADKSKTTEFRFRQSTSEAQAFLSATNHSPPRALINKRYSLMHHQKICVAYNLFRIIEYLDVKF
jgi:Zn-dependent peptidase ImmA (M78 family)